MLVGRIPNATRVLGAPVGWDKAAQGPCGGLPIQDIETSAGPGMMSVWQPTPEELARLQAGAGVSLLVLGTVHPPVSVSVGMPPEGEKVEPVKLTKRPVAFRIREKDGWAILQNEEAAQIEAEHRGVDYQGLYVRDGASERPSGPPRPSAPPDHTPVG